ncbi:MAG: methylenetetrahydrofolate reductase [Atopobiaceae bacterium]|nr:methylenetetrahydrofolate reductase [Atopobiaceae bacterium]MBQ3266607.1 methylenetetrahydrofolate reductase [Atopobiaceae bacterium]
MRIDERLAERQTFSFEIFPPKGDLPIDEAIGVARELDTNNPDWISVTFSAGGSGNSANTVSVSGVIEQQTNTSALAHLTCLGSHREDVDLFLEALGEQDVRNVLALRGDWAPGKEAYDFTYATDLIAYIKEHNPEFCVGAACYPEGHFECIDFETSLKHLKMKQDAGADFLVTQLFFDNEIFYRFREGCARHRIKIPIVCGIMPFTSVRQIQRMAFTCGATIPSKVIRKIVACGDDEGAQLRAGIEYACDQIVDLAANGVDGIHIYTMNRPVIGRAAHEALVDCGYIAG